MKKNSIREYTRTFYHNNHILYILALVLTILNSSFGLLCSWVLGKVLDIITTGQLRQLGDILILVLVMTALEFLVGAGTYWVKSRFLRRALAQYKSLVFSRISAKSISAFTKENTGRYLSTLTNDMSSIEENYLNRTILIVYYCIMFLTTLAMMLFYSWELTLAAIGLSILPVLVSFSMSGKLSRQEKQVSNCNEGFMAAMKDLLNGFAVIKSFKAERQAQNLFDQANGTLEAEKERRRWWEGLLGTLSNSCGALVQLALFLLCAYFSMRGQITVGTVLILTNLCNFLLTPINYIPTYWASRKAAKGLIEKHAQITQENAGRSGKSIQPVLQDALELKSVSFGYEPEQPVLRDISLRFQPGKRYAIVGGSGAGKSTLLNLLMGAHDSYTGSITVDGAELRDISTDCLYDLESLIGQNVFLFDDTIRNNITMFADFDPAQVNQAAEQAGLTTLLREKGEDYRCGENGAGLSGGERQRISIARCLLRGTPILLVDEATAALDAQTAVNVTGAILDLEGPTRIVVTHRLEASLLRRYDEIIVLKNGSIFEQGSFEDLMEQHGLLYSLYTVSNG